MDNEKLFKILTQALRVAVRANMSRKQILGEFCAFTATVAISLAGETGARAAIRQIEMYITDLKEGKFPRP